MNTSALLILVFSLGVMARDLQVCSPGTFWNGQRCLPCQTNQQGGYCTCTQFGTCNNFVCNSGYYKLNSTSTKCYKGCDSDCQSCGIQQNAEVCYSCKLGNAYAQLIGSICVPLSSAGDQCVLYDSTTGICQQCEAGYYATQNINTGGSASNNDVNKNACEPCMSNCINCLSGQTCQKCQQGYALVISKTIQPSCQPCQDSQCLTCQNNVQICTQCQVGYAVSPVTNGCTSCTNVNSQCASCSSLTTCLSCSKGYYLKDTKTCGQCGQYCSKCTNSTSCVVCEGVYQVVADGSCQTCPANCAQCSSATKCTACNNGFYLAGTDNYTCTACSTLGTGASLCAGPRDVPSATPAQITQCQAGNGVYPNFLIKQTDSQLQPTICVQQLTDQCLTLYDVTTTNGAYVCKTCFPGKVILGASCVSCPTGCTACQGQSDNVTLACSTCSQGYYLSNSTCVQCGGSGTCAQCNANGCTSCVSGYYLSNGACTTCAVTFCASCTDGNSTCSACKPTYFYTKSSGTPACKKCPQDCLTCDDPGQTCKTCPPKYIKQYGGCVPITNTFCVEVDESGNCLVCDYQYQLKDGICVNCLSPDSGYVCRDNLKPINDVSATNSTKNSAQFISALIAILMMITYL